MNRRCRQTLLLCLTLALAVSADRSSAAAVDESTLTRAVALKRAGKLVEAEKLLADGTVTDGMIPKVRAALRAATAGVPAAVIDGREAETLRVLLTGASGDESAAGSGGTRIV